MTITYQEVRDVFIPIAEKHGYKFALVCICPMIRELSAQAWSMTTTTLYFEYEGFGEPIDIRERDELDLQLCPPHMKEEVQAGIARNELEAAAWAKDLKEAGMSPVEALGGALEVCESVVNRETLEKRVAASPSPLAIPLELCHKMRAFYRAAKRYNPEKANILKPLTIARDTIARSQSSGENLAQEVLGAINARMTQVRNSTAKGRWVIYEREVERQVIKEFSDFIIWQLLGEKWNWDKSKFSAKDFKLIEDAVWALYLLEQDKENQTTE